MILLEIGSISKSILQMRHYNKFSNVTGRLKQHQIRHENEKLLYYNKAEYIHIYMYILIFYILHYIYIYKCVCFIQKLLQVYEYLLIYADSEQSTFCGRDTFFNWLQRIDVCFSYFRNR